MLTFDLLCYDPVKLGFVMAGRYNLVQEHYVLPVSGGPGVEDVLFGREQRQAVGIKVDRLHAHDGKGFQTTPAASLFTGPHGFRGRTICWKQPQRNNEGRSRPRKQQ